MYHSHLDIRCHVAVRMFVSGRLPIVQKKLFEQFSRFSCPLIVWGNPIYRNSDRILFYVERTDEYETVFFC